MIQGIEPRQANQSFAGEETLEVRSVHSWTREPSKKAIMTQKDPYLQAIPSDMTHVKCKGWARYSGGTWHCLRELGKTSLRSVNQTRSGMMSRNYVKERKGKGHNMGDCRRAGQCRDTGGSLSSWMGEGYRQGHSVNGLSGNSNILHSGTVIPTAVSKTMFLGQKFFLPTSKIKYYFKGQLMCM